MKSKTQKRKLTCAVSKSPHGMTGRAITGGTKWNARDSQYSTKDPEHAIWFDTAWSPAVPVFEALAKRFPAHEILIPFG
jgi:hypothetical protein